jgi:hypothetical protein
MIEGRREVKHATELSLADSKHSTSLTGMTRQKLHVNRNTRPSMSRRFYRFKRLLWSELANFSLQFEFMLP